MALDKAGLPHPQLKDENNHEELRRLIEKAVAFVEKEDRRAQAA